MIIDTHVWMGAWPFGLTHDFSAAQLARHLAASGIDLGVVSHLGGLFAADPAAANAALLHDCRRFPSLSPAPILNPTLPGWREQLAAAQKEPAVRAVKICPSYNDYRLRGREVTELCAAVAEAQLRLIVQVRLIPERPNYFALRVTGVPLADLRDFLARHPQTHPLLLGLYLKEARTLAGTCPNFSMDLSEAEWLYTVEALKQKVPIGRILFGSSTPLLTTHAVLQKLTSSALSSSEMCAIASGNAKAFFARARPAKRE
jgi:predicted TIM-barrel fold metal-dependent hydrolase